MNSKDFITVFTPTFNRASLLPRVYESLLKQEFTAFEWLIVDDGSTDDTEQIIQNFMSDKKIEIRYFRKKNGGKHSAINKGLDLAKGNIFLIIDSDDFLTENALGITAEYWKKIDQDENFCGLIGLSQYEDGTIVGTAFPFNDWQVSFTDVYLKYGVKGDKSVAFKTEILRQYKFPEQDGIRFVFEAVVWHEMARNYSVLAFNEYIQIKEYLINGLSESSYKKWYIEGLSFSYFQLIRNGTYPFVKYPQNFIDNYKYLAINSLLAKTSYFPQLSFIGKIIYLLMLPRAFFSYWNMRKRLTH